jgi:cysteinyl-tRNA synthetase
MVVDQVTLPLSVSEALTLALAEALALTLGDGMTLAETAFDSTPYPAIKTPVDTAAAAVSQPEKIASGPLRSQRSGSVGARRKAAKADEPADAKWPSPYGEGRPGWHIECSAMSCEMLGETFDIHGGGADLQFPHHENEIAQSEGATGQPLARTWMHNGFINVDNEKMSKSLGNFFTIRDLLADWPGEVLRFNMLRTHYRQPIDFTIAGLKESWKTLERWYEVTEPLVDPAPNAEFFAALSDDLNTPAAIASLHQADEMALAGGLGFLGFSKVQLKIASKAKVDTAAIEGAIAARNAARKAKDFKESDRIRDEWLARGIVFKDGPQGTTWEVKK